MHKVYVGRADGQSRFVMTRRRTEISVLLLMRERLRKDRVGLVRQSTS